MELPGQNKQDLEDSFDVGKGSQALRPIGNASSQSLSRTFLKNDGLPFRPILQNDKENEVNLVEGSSIPRKLLVDQTIRKKSRDVNASDKGFIRTDMTSEVKDSGPEESKSLRLGHGRIFAPVQTPQDEDENDAVDQSNIVRDNVDGIVENETDFVSHPDVRAKTELSRQDPGTPQRTNMKLIRDADIVDRDQTNMKIMRNNFYDEDFHRFVFRDPRQLARDAVDDESPGNLMGVTADISSFSFSSENDGAGGTDESTDSSILHVMEFGPNPSTSRESQESSQNFCGDPVAITLLNNGLEVLSHLLDCDKSTTRDVVKDQTKRKKRPQKEAYKTDILAETSYNLDYSPILPIECGAMDSDEELESIDHALRMGDLAQIHTYNMATQVSAELSVQRNHSISPPRILQKVSDSLSDVKNDHEVASLPKPIPIMPRASRRESIG